MNQTTVANMDEYPFYNYFTTKLTCTDMDRKTHLTTTGWAEDLTGQFDTAGNSNTGIHSSVHFFLVHLFISFVVGKRLES